MEYIKPPHKSDEETDMKISTGKTEILMTADQLKDFMMQMKEH